MTTTIAYFPSQCALNSQPVLHAVRQSLGHRDIDLVADSMHADAALIWSVLWHGRLRANQQVYQHYRATNRRVIVIDVGTLIRGETWKIALDHVNALADHALPHILDSDRPKKLGIIRPRKINRRPEILIAAQHHMSLQLNGQDQEIWISDMFKDLRAHTDRQIVVRPHPRSRLDLSRLPLEITVQTPEPVAGTYDDFNFDCGYHAIVNYSSGPGVIGAVHQVPVLVDRSSLAWPMSVDASSLENPPEKDYQRWLIEISHTEYTIDEIARGIWLDRLLPRILQ